MAATWQEQRYIILFKHYTARQWLFSGGALWTPLSVPKLKEAAAMSCSSFAGARYKVYVLEAFFSCHHLCFAENQRSCGTTTCALLCNVV
jgi:hypothetical protein